MTPDPCRSSILTSEQLLPASFLMLRKETSQQGIKPLPENAIIH